jgi:hypothetical protein
MCGVSRDALILQHYEKEYSNPMKILNMKTVNIFPHFHVYDESNECILADPEKKNIICGHIAPIHL